MQKAKEVEVFFDGLCQPINPGGIACYAYVVKDRGSGATLKSEHGLAAEPFSPDATNNVAEYTALIKALEWLAASGLEPEKIVVKSDSQLVVNQMNGRFKVGTKRIVPLFRKAAELKARFRDVRIEWVPRSENREADSLTNRAYNQAFIDNPALFDKIAKK